MGLRTRKRNRNKFQYRATSKRKQMKMKKIHNPLIECLPIKKAWDKNKTAPSNLADMGLVYDLDRIAPIKDKNKHTDGEQPKKRKRKAKPTKVVKQLEEAVSKESEKQAGIRLTNSQVEYATAMVDKHGDDYKAMARDPRNYFQDTWKQIRTKIKLFTHNPKYFAPYLKERGLLNPEVLTSQDKE